MKSIYRKIQSILNQGGGITLKTTGSLSKRTGSLSADLSKTLLPLDPNNLTPQFSETADSFTFLEPVTPAERLILLGGGHISLSVCQFAAACGFSVTVIDDRPSFANFARFPMANQVICDSFHSALTNLTLTPYDYIVIVTRGHRYDGNCLRALYRKDSPAYIGMMGSFKRVHELKELLITEGLSPVWLDSIHAPIGIQIGGITPSEIAVSIVAELIQHRRIPKFFSHPVNHSDLELNIIEQLIKNEEAKAIVTVVSSMGSTPRRAGAKMFVSRTGKITGTIGGGCAEAALIQTALHIIGTGTFQLASIDMSGDIAEEDGMACGGIMTVLIEDASPV